MSFGPLFVQPLLHFIYVHEPVKQVYQCLQGLLCLPQVPQFS